MSIVVVGANHRTAPLELLERMSVRAEVLPKLLHTLDEGDNVAEAVVLSTCNRTEVYLVAERFHGAFGEIRDFFADLTFLPPDAFAESLYIRWDDDAVSHLFEVAAGLDSAVPGEHEILGQVKNAWEVARLEGTARRGLNLLFRHALEVGKRARTETGIARHATSVSQAAVGIADARIDGLRGKRIVVIGAGAMGQGVAAFAADRGAAHVVVANRSLQRAEELVERLEVSGEAVALVDVANHLAQTDVVFGATASPGVIVSADEIADAMASRQRGLLVVDVAMPRDVDPAASAIEGVDLLDMTDVAEITNSALAERQAEAAPVRVIVADEVQRFITASTAREVAPLIATMYERAEEIRGAEFERFAGRLAELDDDQREAVAALTRGIVAKLLHDPTVRLKDAAGTSRGDRLSSSLSELFDL